ncbi:MAG: hypothetical protein KJZ90_15285, partial [Rhodocyclaceae bacterium]|nr:hypothetical protein [Rhodocyclaceae bacterium]
SLNFMFSPAAGPVAQAGRVSCLRQITRQAGLGLLKVAKSSSFSVSRLTGICVTKDILAEKRRYCGATLAAKVPYEDRKNNEFRWFHWCEERDADRALAPGSGVAPG